MEATGLKLRLYFGILLTAVVLSTISISVVEHLSVLDAFYFSVVTIATVGYGDIHPTTSTGKMIAVVLIIAGVGTFLEVIAGLTRIMINRRDKEVRVQKLNMITGLFFSEMGTRLIKIIAAADPDKSSIAEKLAKSSKWRDEAGTLTGPGFNIQVDQLDLEGLRQFLESKGNLLFRLLESPSLLEHETFTELLRSIFHLRDELMNRDELHLLPDADRKHLSGDIMRIYRSLTVQWLSYVEYLEKNYPYMHSLAVRTNPFDVHASAVVHD